MPLVATRDNPVPDGTEMLEVVTRDGVRLRAAAWRAVGADRGTVLILQGRAEFIEKYFEVVGELRALGLAVVAFDWRGQGGSGRALADPHLGHVGGFEDYRLDLEAVQDALALRRARDGSEGRLHVLAHSMGGCVALTAAGEGWLRADSLVALAPMVGLSLVRRPGVARALARLLNRLGLGARAVPGGQLISISRLPFEGNRLCGDRVRYERNKAVAASIGSRAIGSPTIGWVAAAYAAMARLEQPAFAAGIRLPVLVVASDDDPICSSAAIAAFASRLPDGRYMQVAGARHEILHETGELRAAFWRAFVAFLAEAERPADAEGPTAEPALSLALSP